MKARWQQLAARIDALSERERVLVFAGLLAVLAFLGQVAVLGPLQHRQDVLTRQIADARASLAETNAAIERKVAEAGLDPDLPARARLAAVRADTDRLGKRLRAMQSGLVPPDRIAPLLEAILRANGRLKLVSMQTLPVSSLSELGGRAGQLEQATASVTAAPAQAAKEPDLLFRHGVELTVRGSYLDMVDTMAALEALPTQLFWGKAQFEVEQYPSARLTLTLYTLSLDPKWMTL